MKIYSSKSTVILDIAVEDNSYRYRSIMGDHKVVLYFSLPESIEIPIGSYIEFQGQKYTLLRPEHLKKNGTRKFEYEVTFGSNLELLKQFKYKFLSINPFKLKFPLTAKPERFLRLLVENLNINDSGWHVGECIDAAEKEISFNHDDCYSVLSRIASEFGTEWEIEGKTIHLRKVEHNKEYPLALSYGKGNGFRVGVGRSNNGEKRPVTILYVQGGERNINKKEYGSETLRLPIDYTVDFEGRSYKTDSNGMSIQRVDKPLTSIVEDSYDGSQFYPKHIGSVTSVELEHSTDDEGNPVVFYDIIDSGIPESLDYSKYTMAGERATIIFQSGMLAGKEFQILTDEDGKLSGYIHKERRFKLVSNETEGGRMPNETFCPQKDDTYAVFHIQMPPEYVENASREMFLEAVRYMYENEEEMFTFSGELDPIWASQNWLSLGGKIIPGSYVLFSDNQFQPEGIKIRITGVTDYINRPHQPNIELSNSPVAGYLSNDLKKLQAQEVVNESLYNSAIQYTKRRFRDAAETQKMLEEAVEGFETGINPVWIKTMSLLAGSEDLQFRFIASLTNPVSVAPNIVMEQESKLFSVQIPQNASLYLQHMTLGIDSLTYKKQKDYKTWLMEPYTSAPLDNATEPYYLYAICSKTGSGGKFDLKPESYKVDHGDSYYFLVGTLSSEYEGERSYTSLYGFTEILPGRITTKTIVSDDGETYFNLETGEIGGTIKFKAGSSGYKNLEDTPDVEGISKKASDALSKAESASTLANTANTAANTANITANSKARVFYSTYTPYGANVNDIWVDGTNIKCYNGYSWVLVSKYDQTQTIINGGLISTGALTVGTSTANGTGGIAGSGTIRIWAGGILTGASTYAPSNATFTVDKDGVVIAKEMFKLQDNLSGMSGKGNTDLSVRFWAGSAYIDSAPFRVLRNGKVFAKEIEIDSTAGINGTGTTRLWIGGTSTGAPFRVSNTGKLFAKEIEIDSAAGISGAGTTRLWIGGTSASAPFRVTSDGSMYATKGKIAGFDISNGWLKCSSNSDKDVGYIDMRGTNTRIAFGSDLIPGVVGGVFTCTGIIQNTNGSSSTNQTIGLQIKAGGAAKYAVAADLDGGLKVRGGISFVEDVPDVSDATDTITSQDLAFRRTFVFQPSAYRSVHLPNSSNISSMFGYNSKGYAASWQSVIKITIIVTRHANSKINIQCTDPIINNNGGTVKENNSVSLSNFDMSKGDCCELAYFNGAWYILSLMR